MYQPRLYQIKHIGGVLEFFWWADSKTDIGSLIWLSFHGENTESILLQMQEIAGTGAYFRHSRVEKGKWTIGYNL